MISMKKERGTMILAFCGQSLSLQLHVSNSFRSWYCILAQVVELTVTQQARYFFVPDDLNNVRSTYLNYEFNVCLVWLERHHVTKSAIHVSNSFRSWFCILAQLVWKVLRINQIRYWMRRYFICRWIFTSTYDCDSTSTVFLCT